MNKAPAEQSVATSNNPTQPIRPQENDNPLPATPLKPFATRIGKKCADVKTMCEPIIWVVGVAAAIIGGFYYLLGPRVDEAAKKVVLSSEVLEQIASRLRPYAVINTKLNASPATFEYDSGSFSDVVDSIDFHQGEQKYIGILTFRMKRYVRLPLVRPLTTGIYVHSFWQTNKFDWAYEIRPSFTTESVGGVLTGSMPDDFPGQNCRFFVELLTK